MKLDKTITPLIREIANPSNYISIRNLIPQRIDYAIQYSLIILPKSEIIFGRTGKSNLKIRRKIGFIVHHQAVGDFRCI